MNKTLKIRAFEAVIDTTMPQGQQVRQALPDVMELSRANIAPLLGESAMRIVPAMSLG